MDYDLAVNAPEKGWITATGPDLPYPIALRVARDRLGRVVVTGLQIAPDPPVELTVTALRKLPLGAIKSQLSAGLGGRGMRGFVAGAVFAATDRRRQRALGVEHFNAVVAALRAAPDRPPIDALRERWPTVSDYTRYRWLRTADLMGLLDPEEEASGEAGGAAPAPHRRTQAESPHRTTSSRPRRR